MNKITDFWIIRTINTDYSSIILAENKFEANLYSLWLISFATLRENVFSNTRL